LLVLNPDKEHFYAHPFPQTLGIGGFMVLPTRDDLFDGDGNVRKTTIVRTCWGDFVKELVLCSSCSGEERIQMAEKDPCPGIEKRSWEEFRDNGFFWFLNRIIHVFGWSIVFEEEEDGSISDVYPARTAWRGFDHKTEWTNFQKVTKFMKGHVGELCADVGLEEP
jgi:hypothetical protein